MRPTSRAPEWLRRFTLWVAATRLGMWLFASLAHRADRLFLRLSANELTLAGWLTGLPVILLTTTGARSKQPRSLPLVGIVEGERLVLIGSNFGRKHNPAWVYNLRAHPSAWVSWDGRAGAYQARPADESEYPRYWQLAVNLFPGYARYRASAGSRPIQIFILTPEA